MRQSGLLLGSLALACFNATAQGSISDGGATYDLTDIAVIARSTTSNRGFSNFRCGNGPDNLAHSWWYYQDANGNGGAFNTSRGQLTENYGRNTATLAWSDVDGLGLFAATLFLVINETGPDSARLDTLMEIRNVTPQPQFITIYHYIDFDHNNSFGNDFTLPGSSRNRFVVSDDGGGCSSAWADRPTNFEAGPFPGLRNRTRAGAPLADTGLPFGSPASPRDFTGIFEWRNTFVPAGGSVIFRSVLGCNDLLAGVPGQSLNYGAALGNTAGIVPTIDSGPPLLGADLEIQVNGDPSATVALLVAGLTRASRTSCGLTLNLRAAASAPVLLTGGTGAFRLPGRHDPIFSGTTLYWQAFIPDLNSSSPCFPFVHTDGLEITYGD